MADPGTVVAIVKAGIDVVKDVMTEINKLPQPGIVIELVNGTGRTLTRMGDHFDHGGFGKFLPKAILEPFQADVFTVEASGLATGVEGSVTYAAESGGQFLIGFSAPWLGTNTVNVNEVAPPYHAVLACYGSIAAAKHSKARYDLVEKVVPVPDAQSGWRSCPNCQSLYFADSKSKSVCPKRAGGGHLGALLPHQDTGSFGYINYLDTRTFGHIQDDWRWCHKCQGLYFAGTPGKGAGVCPAGGEHHNSGSGNYGLVHEMAPIHHMQMDWRWCQNCQGLFYGPGKGWCPAGGKPDPKTGAFTFEHNGTGTFNYGLRFE